MTFAQFILLNLFILSSQVSGKELVIYSASNNTLNDQAFLRLQQALNTLGHQAKYEIVATRRSLQLANTVGDGELVRVAELKTLYPELTNNLSRIEEPLMHIAFVELTKRNTSAPPAESSKLAIPKDVFILQQEYPAAAIVDGNEKLVELLKADRVDRIIIPVSDEKMLHDYQLYSSQYHLKTLKTQKIYTYLHKKHQKLAEQLAPVLQAMNQSNQ